MGKAKTTASLFAVLSFFIVHCVHKTTEQVREPSSQSAEKNPPQLNSYRFEYCEQNRLYLEDDMEKMPSEYFEPHIHEGMDAIPVKCIQFAQRNFNGHYGVCAEQEDRPRISKVKPCLTRNYTMLAYNAYHDVMDCFNLNPRDFYLQIMIESGFHINAINKTGFDSGMSQFTANGIKKVTANNMVERTRRILLESSRPSCQRISSIVGSFNIDAFSVEKRCSMISLPKNPYRAMMFNYLHTLLDQIAIEELLSDIPEIQDALTDKIKRQFVYLAYNRGLTGLRNRVKGYIATRNYFSQTITENDLDLNKNLTAVKKVLNLEPEKKAILKKARVRNMSFAEYAVIHDATYVSDMSAAGDYVQRNLGNSCGDL
ncbi:hypothetical protein K2P97_00885 [bacterium]|nr:hypothetical protein [bacterium]